MRHFSERIRDIIKKEGAQRFSERTGTPRHILRDWGSRNVVPTIRELGQFCSATHIDPVWLLIGSHPQSQSFSDVSDPALVIERIISAKSVMSLSELSRVSGISRGTLNSYVRGVNAPKADKVVVLARVLNLSLRWLLTGEGSMHPFEEVQEIETAPSKTALRPQKEAAVGELPSDFEAARSAMRDLNATLEVCAETKDWHAVGLVRRDLEALLSDIRRLYPDLA